MIDLQHNLTVDDLIIEYMVAKLENGYDSKISENEFKKFLEFFVVKMPYADIIIECSDLFKKFMERKSKRDWAKKIGREQVFLPHFDIRHDDSNNDYILSTNYRFSRYDTSIINTYFMAKIETNAIRTLINDYLKGMPKMQIDMNSSYTKNDLIIGKYVTVNIISFIWDEYVKKQIDKHHWPEQCRDINKYLLSFDLATSIGLKSLKNELLELYKVVSERIAILYSMDKKLEICSSLSNGYLANFNYHLISLGFEKIFDDFFSQYKSILYIDLAKLILREEHIADDRYYFDDEKYESNAINVPYKKDKELIKHFDNTLKKILTN